MNADLEKIVDSVLANGELTDRSRELLMKKAEQLGVDLLDFELELESKIAQKKASTNGPLPIYTSNTPQSNKEGDLKKCPSCGAPVSSFNTKCSDCGHEFRNTQASSSITKLYEDLKKAEEDLKVGLKKWMVKCL
jgi:DNA-directed RNA polymerase subunit RPC12/RpoP